LQHHNFFSTSSATPHLYTLSLHDALPIFQSCRKTLPVTAPLQKQIARRRRQRRNPPTQFLPRPRQHPPNVVVAYRRGRQLPPSPDRKSTRLNSSHVKISYAVFCLKKKKHQ